MTHYINKLIVSFLIFGFVDVMGQNYYVVRKEIKRLELVNKELYKILDSLVNEERKCDEYYKRRLLWSIDFNKSKDSKGKDIDVIEVTLFSGFAEDAKPMGYFEVNCETFILFGDYIHPDFFVETNNKRVFKTINPIAPYPEDYSLWTFAYKKGKIFLVKAHYLPCDE